LSIAGRCTSIIFVVDEDGRDGGDGRRWWWIGEE